MDKKILSARTAASRLKQLIRKSNITEEQKQDLLDRTNSETYKAIRAEWVELCNPEKVCLHCGKKYKNKIVRTTGLTELPACSPACSIAILRASHAREDYVTKVCKHCGNDFKIIRGVIGQNARILCDTCVETRKVERRQNQKENIRNYMRKKRAEKVAIRALEYPKHIPCEKCGEIVIVKRERKNGVICNKCSHNKNKIVKPKVIKEKIIKVKTEEQILKRNEYQRENRRKKKEELRQHFKDKLAEIEKQSETNFFKACMDKIELEKEIKIKFPKGLDA